jgi:nitroreductase
MPKGDTSVDEKDRYLDETDETEKLQLLGGASTDKGDRYPNETMKLLIERASCRNFSDKEISPEVLQLVLAAGIHAPTGGNLQPYSIIKIENDEAKQKLAGMCGQSCIGKAPVLLLFCIDWHRIERWASLEVAPFTATSSFENFWVSFQDTSICAQSICTAADSMGLGSVYIGGIIEFPPDIRDRFQLPKGVFPVVLLCIGYPKTRPLPRKKLGVDVIVHSERYREMEDQELIDAFNGKYRGRKLKITEKRLETISEVCREVHGEEFAKRCVDRIKENGYINRVQWYFGLEYRANSQAHGNETYLKFMEEFGFNWFKKYPPFDDKAT